MSGAWVYCELPRMIASQPVSINQIKASLNSLTNTQALKELFYNHLKYDRVDTTISARTLPESVRANLKGSKMVLLAQGGAQNKFDVIYTQLNSQQIRKQEQRGIIDALLTIHPYSLSNSKFKTSLGHSSLWTTIRGEQLARRLDISAHKIFEFGIAVIRCLSFLIRIKMTGNSAAVVAADGGESAGAVTHGDRANQ
jgi:hypothetical protein